MIDRRRPPDLHLHISARPALGEVARLLDNVDHHEPVNCLEDLTRVLEELCVCPRRSHSGSRRTLDLIGHSDDSRLLRLGESVVDLGDDDVWSLFQRMASDRVLESLGIGELRLLGCETALSAEGQTTIRELTRMLGIRVLGMSTPLYSAHFGRKGLKDRYECLLRDATNLPGLDDDGAGDVRCDRL